MRNTLGGFAAFCLGASLLVSCGGGGSDSLDGTGNSEVGAKAPSGAAGNAGGKTTTSSSAGAAGTTSGAAGSSATPAATDTTPAATDTTPAAPGATGAAPAATDTTPAATPTAPATAAPATAPTPAATTTAAPVATPAAAATTAAPAPAGNAGATIVPLYTPPTDGSWDTVVAAKRAHPRVGVVAVVNPASGPGGGMNSSYAVGIDKLAAAGVKVIGYVATGYGARAAADVKADIDRWQNFYPGKLGGIFFDEQSNQANLIGHYRDLSQYAKSKGLAFTVGNPGTDTAESYVGALDVMLIYESGGLPTADRMGGWHAKYAPSNFGVIPYATNLDAAFVRSARQHVGYVYLQNDNLPNPWDTVPAYFADLLAALE
jgi:hypothetical protein